MLYPLWLRNKSWHTILCVIFILILSLLPQDKLPKPLFSFEDLVVHITMYAGLAWCISLSIFDKIQSQYKKKFLLIPIYIGLFGLMIEVLQKTLPINRFFSWLDAICNFLGACIFYFLFLRIKKIKQ